MSYFETIVLSSVGMSKKPLYSLQESSKILGISERAVLRLGRKGRLEIIEGHISYEEFERFFK